LGIIELLEDRQCLLPRFPCAIDIADVPQCRAESAQADGFSLPVADFVPVRDGFPIRIDGFIQPSGVEVRISQVLQGWTRCQLLAGLTIQT
jgi:hypothetical protein